MKVQALFKAYEELISSKPGIEETFSNSGILNVSARLDFGFFPLGSGILTGKSKIEEAEIDNCNIMVLGNDFGTLEYVEKNCPDKKEKPSNKTIYNLREGLGLDLDTTFFTNLFLGVRKEGTNIKRAEKLKDDYKKVCFEFFKIQLDLLNPKIVLCLGNEVGHSLFSVYPDKFSNYSMSKTSLSKMFAETTQTNYLVNTNDDFFGQRKFVLIPHPSFAHINWNRNDIKEKIRNAIQI